MGLCNWMEQHLESDPALVAELRFLASMDSRSVIAEDTGQRSPQHVSDRTASSFAGFSTSLISSDLDPPRSLSASAVLCQNSVRNFPPTTTFRSVTSLADCVLNRHGSCRH